MTQSRLRLENVAEITVAERLIADGYEVVRRGWPDFLAYNPDTGSVRFVEVKSYPDAGMSPAQREGSGDSRNSRSDRGT